MLWHSFPLMDVYSILLAKLSSFILSNTVKVKRLLLCLSIIISLQTIQTLILIRRLELAQILSKSQSLLPLRLVMFCFILLLPIFVLMVLLVATRHPKSLFPQISTFNLNILLAATLSIDIFRLVSEVMAIDSCDCFDMISSYHVNCQIIYKIKRKGAFNLAIRCRRLSLCFLVFTLFFGCFRLKVKRDRFRIWLRSMEEALEGRFKLGKVPLILLRGWQLIICKWRSLRTRFWSA